MNSHYKAWSYNKEKKQSMERMYESWFEKTQRKNVSINHLISHLGQRKSFCRQRILESSCARKETVDIDMSKTSTNGERKILQPVNLKEWTCQENKEVEQFNQFRITSTKVIPTEKLWAGYISTISQGFKREILTVLRIHFCSLPDISK